MNELRVTYQDAEICTARWPSVFVSVFREWASLVSAAVLVSRTEAPTRIFEDPMLASRWVAGLAGQPAPLDAAALCREVTRLMGELGVWL